MALAAQPNLAEVAAGETPGRPGASHPRPSLRTRLLAADLLTALTVWAVALVGGGATSEPARMGAVLVLSVLACLVLLRRQRLYRSRVAAVRSEELARLVVVAIGTGLVAAAAAHLVDLDLSVAVIVGGAAATFAALAVERSRFQSWLQRHRADGRFLRPVVIAGDPACAAELVELFEDCPELGVHPVGFVGARPAEEPFDEIGGVPNLGPARSVLAAVRATGATGVFFCAPSLSTDCLNALVRDLHAMGVHVHVWSGINGVHRRRLWVQPIGHEPFLYVEPVALSRSQTTAKRALDIVGALLALLVTLPLQLAAMVAIALDSRGPVVFRQQRVGLDSVPFTLFKLRTMTADAEDRIDDLAELNERGGPLFKVSDDPRVTRVGRWLRATSIDELPQLVNVLRGEMSLVGPRPALASEVEEFDGRLLERQQVKPGITGLWQVEGSAKAPFSVYRRLDLFYVDNWSLSLDVVILLKTVGVVWRRLVTSGALRLRRSRGDDAASTSETNSLRVAGEGSE